MRREDSHANCYAVGMASVADEQAAGTNIDKRYTVDCPK